MAHSVRVHICEYICMHTVVVPRQHAHQTLQTIWSMKSLGRASVHVTDKDRPGLGWKAFPDRQSTCKASVQVPIIGCKQDRAERKSILHIAPSTSVMGLCLKSKRRSSVRTIQLTYRIIGPLVFRFSVDSGKLYWGPSVC